MSIRVLDLTLGLRWCGTCIGFSNAHWSVDSTAMGMDDIIPIAGIPRAA